LAISRARKEELLTIYRQQLAESDGFVMASYLHLSTPQLQDLRGRVRELEGATFVVKNTLFRKVLEEAGLEVPDDLLTGPLIVGFSHQDVPSMARLFREFARGLEEGEFVIKGGMIEGRLFDAQEAAAVASLPTRDELLATVLRTFNAPATQMAGVVASGIRQVLNVIKAYADKLEESAGAGEAVAASA